MIQYPHQQVLESPVKVSSTPTHDFLDVGAPLGLTAVHQTGSSRLPSEELNEDEFILIDITSQVTD